MVCIRQITLDILKPHHPNSLEFASEIAKDLPGAIVEVTVVEVDEHTESVVLIIEGSNIDYAKVEQAIANMGGSVHSIDKVEVYNDAEDDARDNT